MSDITHTKSTARFDEFATVDWIDDAAKERRRLQGLWGHLGTRQVSLSWVYLAYDAAVSWIVVLLAGVLIGVNTAMISIVTEWLSDAKQGVCSRGWWLNQKFCCWEEADEACAAWLTWDQALVGGSSGFIRWLAFVTTGTAMAATCAFLVRGYAPLAAGSGLGEIKAILGGFVIRGFMGGWTLVMKSVGLALAVGSGLSVGKEGPAVHMGCCIGNVVARNFSKYRRSAARQREVISAAAAAGVAVAFGAPIGGVLFSLEDLSSHFPRKTLWRSFLCALIATVSLQAMNPFRTGKLVMFQATYDRDWHFFETGFFVLLGVFGGVFGGICIRLHLRVAAWRRRYVRPSDAVTEAAILALGTTAITYANVYTRADMGELLAYLLQECPSATALQQPSGGWGGMCDPANSGRVIIGLLAATVIRAIGTIVAYGCRVPCGIFVPSMAIGASFGRMLGTLAQHLHRTYPKWALFAQCAPDTPCITPATYAFLGAAAAMCGVTKVTVAVVVIMYELTGALNFIVPTMIVVMVARVIGDAIVEGGISEQLILLNGLPFLGEDEDECLLDTVAAAIMRPAEELVVVPIGISLYRLQRLLENSSGFQGFPVVDSESDMRLVGYVHRDAVVKAIASYEAANNETMVSFSSSGPGSISLAHLVNPSPTTVRPRTAAETVVEIFRKLGPRVVLVASEEDGTLAGLLTRKDILRHTRSH
ncbi:glycerol ethanol, ferric requiring protein [Coemansia sp. S100]|nr:glycerol ethanol, ferric requiring protein [Coemansia sp. S100]